MSEKIEEMSYIEDLPLPELVSYQNVLNTPTSLGDINISEGSAMDDLVANKITVTSGAIGGWNIVAGYIYNLVSGTPTATPSDGIVLASSNKAIIIYENTEKRVEFGYLSAGIYGIKGYADDGTTVIFEISDTQKYFDGAYLGAGTVVSSAVKPALRNSSHNLVFSVTDADTVAWASGTITLSDLTAYSITGANTGNMTARTYIYLDIAVSTTLLQISTTFSDAVGDNKILIASAQNGTGEATFYVIGGIGGINIDANSIIVANLAAINADLGSITSGNITIDASGYIKGGQTAFNTGTGFFLGYDTDAYKFSVGNPGEDYLTFDGVNISLWATLKAKNMKHYYISDDTYQENATVVDTRSLDTYVKVKTVNVSSDWGRVTMRIRFGLKTTSTGYIAYGKIYKNGVAVGTERTTQSSTYVYFNEDIEFVPGDAIQLYLKTNYSTNDVYNDTLQIRGTVTPQKFTITSSTP